MNVPMYGPVTTADRLDRLLAQQGEALSQFMRQAATDAVYHLRAQHRKLLESDAIATDEIITAQHDETGRLWTGPRSNLPHRFAEVAAPVPAREWIPVGERLPDYDIAVLIYPIEQSKTVARIPRVTWPQVGELTKGGGWFSKTYGGLGSSGAIVGYWMPLPPPPAVDK
jgi:hypothetical protein